MKKLNEIGQIRSDWAHIENPDSGDRVLDSPGGLGQFFQKIGKKIKIEFSKKSEKTIFESIAKPNPPPPRRPTHPTPGSTPRHSTSATPYIVK